SPGFFEIGWYLHQRRLYAGKGPNPLWKHQSEVGSGDASAGVARPVNFFYAQMVEEGQGIARVALDDGDAVIDLGARQGGTWRRGRGLAPAALAPSQHAELAAQARNHGRIEHLVPCGAVQ